MPPNEPIPIAWPATVLLLPGWQNSGPDHWQSRWERPARLHAGPSRTTGTGHAAATGWPGWTRCCWPCPRTRPARCCWSPTAWAASWSRPGRRTRRTMPRGSARRLLVAPPDTERPEMPPQLFGLAAGRARAACRSTRWRCFSRNDPYGSIDRTAGDGRRLGIARRGCRAARPSSTASPGLGDWPEGLDAAALAARRFAAACDAVPA